MRLRLPYRDATTVLVRAEVYLRLWGVHPRIVARVRGEWELMQQQDANESQWPGNDLFEEHKYRIASMYAELRHMRQRARMEAMAIAWTAGELHIPELADEALGGETGLMRMQVGQEIPP